MAKSGPKGPTKYRKEYPEMLIKHMEEGLSYECFAGLIGVTRDCLYKWEKAHPEFLYAKNMARQKSLLFWEKALRAQSLGKLNGNASTLIFTMKCRFGWNDQPKELEESERYEQPDSFKE